MRTPARFRSRALARLTAVIFAMSASCACSLSRAGSCLLGAALPRAPILLPASLARSICTICCKPSILASSNAICSALTGLAWAIANAPRPGFCAMRSRDANSAFLPSISCVARSTAASAPGSSDPSAASAPVLGAADLRLAPLVSACQLRGSAILEAVRHLVRVRPVHLFTIRSPTIGKIAGWACTSASAGVHKLLPARLMRGSNRHGDVVPAHAEVNTPWTPGGTCAGPVLLSGHDHDVCGVSSVPRIRTMRGTS